MNPNQINQVNWVDPDGNQSWVNVASTSTLDRNHQPVVILFPVIPNTTVIIAGPNTQYQIPPNANVVQIDM